MSDLPGCDRHVRHRQRPYRSLRQHVAGRPDRAGVTPDPRSPVGGGSWQLAHGPQAPGDARRITQSVLARWSVGHAASESVLLVVSELVTNAVQHARAPLVLQLLYERTGLRVWVEVTDGGPALQVGPRVASLADDEHGRGLGLIAALATERGTRTHEHGATHWALLPAAV